MSTKYASPELVQLFRLCNIIRWMLLTFLLIQVGLYILAWIIPTPLTVGPMLVQLDPGGVSAAAIHQLSAMQKLLCIAIGLPGLLTLTYGVRRLGQTLDQFQKGEIFFIQTIGHVRAFAGATLIATVLFNIEMPLRNLVLNLVAESGPRHPIPFEVSSNELLLLLVGGLFYLIVGVMHEGRRLSEENEGFV